MWFITLLVALQVITLAWLYMIMKVAYRVVMGGGGAEDTRSDEEDEGEDECMNDEDDENSSPKGPASKTGEVTGNGHPARHIPSSAFGND